MSVVNILKLMERASSTDITEGRVAYYRYNEVMRRFAAHYGYPLERTAACFVSLSPSNSYEGNLRSLASVLQAHRDGALPESAPVTTFHHCRARAWTYLEGEDFLQKTEGKKIRSFYQNILNPLDPFPVTVDGHALNIYRDIKVPLRAAAVLKWDYEEIADAYREVARRLRLQAHQVQAIAWYAWKREKSILYTPPQLELFEDRSGDLWRALRSPEDLKPLPRRARELVETPRRSYPAPLPFTDYD